MIRKAQDSWRGPAAVRGEIDQSIARREDSLADGPRRKPPDDNDDDDENSDQDIADARRFASYEAMKSRLQDAWRTPNPVPQRNRDAAEPDNNSRQFVHGSDPEDAQAKRDQAYQEYAASLSEQWKTNPSAAAQVQRIAAQTRGGR
jgi:hypothetical protein